MFLYESILNLIVFGILIWFIRRYWNRVPAGTVFALYVMLYNAYRVPLETLKVDTADIFLGQRVNVWVSGVLFLIGLVAFVMLFRRRRPRAALVIGCGRARRRPCPGTRPRPAGGGDRRPPANAAAQEELKG